MTLATYVIFFVAGLGFGFAARGIWIWLPLLFPLLLFLVAAFSSGVDGVGAIRLIIALVVTALGVLAGLLLERRAGGPEPARYA